MVKNLSYFLFGKTKTRPAILFLLYSHADDSFYLRQIVRITDFGLGPIQRELKQLTEAGLICSFKNGHQVYYRANPTLPVFKELKALITKTIDADDALHKSSASFAGSKYGQYIVTKLKQNIAQMPWTPNDIISFEKGKGGRIFWLDNEVIPGAFYVEVGWTIPEIIPNPAKIVVECHGHPFDEVLCFCGTDMSDPYALGGEVELWLGDEKHILTESCVVFIPKGLQHGPIIFHRVDRPILTFNAAPCRIYAVRDNYHLTNREMEIIQCVSIGLKNTQIAAKLNISILTVQTHLNNIFNKTLSKNRTNLAGLVESGVR